jgi:hypothetical protein
MMQYRTRFQAGIALPVMMIMLAVMLVSSIYLLRSSTSTTLTTSNLAYDSALSKAADLGIYTGLQWLNSLGDNKIVLLNDDSTNGYKATLVQGQDVSNPSFWQGSKMIWDHAAPKPNQIEYVIHRLCTLPGNYNRGDQFNSCTVTTAKKKLASPSEAGGSLASDAPTYQGKPKLHYLITARIAGARGGNVINQAVAMLGP